MMSLNKMFENHIRKIWCEISQHQNIIDFHKKDIRAVFDNKKNKGFILAKETPLKFKKDNAILAVYEEIILNNDALYINKYSYHYERYHQNGEIEFYFRYDKDPNATKAEDFSQTDWDIAHAKNHLHVNGEMPRYKTHETHFMEIFNLIRLNYYRH